MDKLKELIHYISVQCASKDNVGSTVINKLLFYADFYHFAKHGKPITGTPYQKEEFGIIPTQLLRARGELLSEGKISIVRVDYHGRTQERSIPTKDFKRHHLSDDELLFVDDIIRRFGSLNGSEISKLNHREAPFQYARYGEEIPYMMAHFLGDVSIPPSIVAKAVELAKKHGYKIAA